MEIYSIIIILFAIAIGLSPVARKFSFPYPVLLLMAGIGVGFMPHFEIVNIKPEIVFLIFLPPFLYDAAYNIPFREFKQNLGVISLLAFTLVFLTTSAIAILVHYMLGLDWSLSFVLGAILSPPDSIAASGVTKDLGLPHRTGTILEGESLINDASALIALRFAVAAVAGSQFVFLQAGLMFLVTLAGGAVLGLILAHIFIFATQKLADKDVIVALNLLLPFAIYLLSEEISVSGVIAVVVFGLTMSQHKNQLHATSVKQVESFLDTSVFILSGLIFMLIGIEFPQVIKTIPDDQFLPLISIAFLIFLVALLVRMVVIFGYKRQQQIRYKLISERFRNIGEKQIQYAERRLGIKHSFEDRLKYARSLLLNRKEAFVIGWSGMRGIVSLAAALSLPLVMADGSSFPYRDTLIFLTVAVVVIMLFIQGLGLPLIIRFLNFKEDNIVTENRRS